jgi:hypothetical protein
MAPAVVVQALVLTADFKGTTKVVANVSVATA